jgi:2'-5' RNA ligase
MNSYPAYISFEPDYYLSKFISNSKHLVFSLVGNQKYLQDPPHLTLQVGDFFNLSALSGLLESIAKTISCNHVEIDGWHVFQDDPLTGGHTVVANITEEFQIKVREIQSLILHSTRPLINIETCIQRYSPSWEKLTPVQRVSAKAWGFPFTGTDWHPHVTVASISQDHWSLVWDTLQKFSPHGVFTFPKLCIYRIDQNQVSEKIAEFPFADL